MELNDYQNKAMGTCLPTSENFSYMMLNLVGEVGELASKIAKGIRKDKIAIGVQGKNHLCYVDKNNTCNPDYEIISECDLPQEFEDFDKDLMKEAGDILWQLSGLCDIMGWDLQDVADMNLEKLASRKKRNVINGSGDNR